MLRAPDIRVVVGARSDVLVFSIRKRKEERMADSIWANCGYLFGEVPSRRWSTPAISTSGPLRRRLEPGSRPELLDEGEGYSQTARLVCAAMTATLLSLPKARCALINTKMLAIAFDIGNWSWIAAQARGFVSMTTVRREGVWLVKPLSS